MPQIHPTAVVEEGVEIGSETAVWHFAHLRSGAHIGAQCIIGERSYVAGGAWVGNRVKIHNGVTIPALVTLEDGVFVGPNVVFPNDRYPRATTPDLQALRTSGVDERIGPTRVCQGASIGAGALIGSNVVVGRFAMVGMGAVVTRSVPDFHLVVGHPAVSVAVVCRCGHCVHRFATPTDPSAAEVVCPACALPYRINGRTVTELAPPQNG